MTGHEVRVSDQEWQALFECLIWQANATDDAGDVVPLDYLGFDRSDIDREVQEQVKREYREFLTENEEQVNAYMEHTDVDLDQVAHDWVLTRNGHGTGFWDRCYCGHDEAARHLSEVSRAQGEIDLYIGDDGKLYV